MAGYADEKSACHDRFYSWAGCSFSEPGSETGDHATKKHRQNPRQDLGLVAFQVVLRVVLRIPLEN